MKIIIEIKMVKKIKMVISKEITKKIKMEKKMVKTKENMITEIINYQQ